MRDFLCVVLEMAFRLWIASVIGLALSGVAFVGVAFPGAVRATFTVFCVGAASMTAFIAAAFAITFAFFMISKKRDPFG